MWLMLGPIEKRLGYVVMSKKKPSPCATWLRKCAQFQILETSNLTLKQHQIECYATYYR